MEEDEIFLFGSGDFSSSDITDPSSVPKLFSFSSINFSSNPISNLSTMPTLPNLEELNLNDTSLSSLEGAAPQPQLNSISFLRTPFSKFEFASIMCVIAFGESLSHINDSRIQEYEKKRGSFLRFRLQEYIREGWVITSDRPLCIEKLSTKDKLEITEEMLIENSEPVINKFGLLDSPIFQFPPNDVSSIKGKKKKGKKKKRRKSKLSSIGYLPLPKPKLWSARNTNQGIEEESNDSSTLMVDSIVFSDDDDARREDTTINDAASIKSSCSLPKLKKRKKSRKSSTPKSRYPSFEFNTQIPSYMPPPVVPISGNSKIYVVSEHDTHEEEEGGENAKEQIQLRNAEQDLPQNHHYVAPPLNLSNLETAEPAKTYCEGKSFKRKHFRRKSKASRLSKLPNLPKSYLLSNQKKKSLASKAKFLKEILQKSKENEIVGSNKDEDKVKILDRSIDISIEEKEKEKEKITNQKETEEEEKVEKEEPKIEIIKQKKAPPLLPLNTSSLFMVKDDKSDGDQIKPNKILRSKKVFGKKKAATEDPCTEIFETSEYEEDNDPPVFKKVNFFELIGIAPDSGDELLSQDENEQEDEKEDTENIYDHSQKDLIETLRVQGRQRFYQLRTIETSTLEEMERFVAKYVRSALQKEKST